MRKSESIIEYAKAFCKAQLEIKQPLKDKDNPFFKSKYVPLENVTEAITTAFANNGISFSQDPTTNAENGYIDVATLVMHTSGEWVEYGPLSVKPTKNDVQGAGSAITYAKRYALSAIFGITSDQDDDGNEASKPNNSSQSTKVATIKRQKTKYQTPKISNIQVETYKSDLSDIAKTTNQNVDELTKWLTETLKVKALEDLHTEHIVSADELINKLKKKAGLKND
ncbi:TPA: ERF family protein [Streptococcus agalactiae]|nr:ERF family protein [Streptococcus agalactiae]